MLRVDRTEFKHYLYGFLSMTSDKKWIVIDRTLCRQAKEALLNGDDVLLLGTDGLPISVCHYEGTKLIEEEI